MTDLKALDAAARKTADDIAYYSGGSKHNEPLEKLQTELVRLYRTGKLAPVDAVKAVGEAGWLAIRRTLQFLDAAAGEEIAVFTPHQGAGDAYGVYNGLCEAFGIDPGSTSEFVEPILARLTALENRT